MVDIFFVCTLYYILYLLTILHNVQKAFNVFLMPRHVKMFKMTFLGKIDEIFGCIREYHVSVKLSENIKAKSFAKGMISTIEKNLHKRQTLGFILDIFFETSFK